MINPATNCVYTFSHRRWDVDTDERAPHRPDGVVESKVSLGLLFPPATSKGTSVLDTGEGPGPQTTDDLKNVGLQAEESAVGILRSDEETRELTNFLTDLRPRHDLARHRHRLHRYQQRPRQRWS